MQPNKVCEHTATVVNGNMLVFGGLGNFEGTAYSLNLTNMKWSWINNVKYKRNGHSADLIAGSIYLFGGE